VLTFAIVLTILTAGAALSLRALVELEEAPWWFLLACAPCVLIPVLGIGYVCGFLDCVVTSAAVGEAQYIRWPGRELRLAFKSCGVWLSCFLAGPVVPALTAFFFWLHAGDPIILDWLILVELGSVSAGLWLFNVLAVSQNDRLGDLHPERIVQLVQRLSYEVLLVILGAGFVTIALGCGIVFALANLQTQVWLGLAALLGSWIAILGFASFILRWLGVWCYHKRRAAQLAPRDQVG
jgi:hypothetical protein